MSVNVIRKIEGRSQSFPASQFRRSVVARPLMRVESKPLVPRSKAAKVEIGYQSSGVVLLKVHRSSQVIASA